MNCLWKYVRNITGGIGGVLIYLAVSTSDYYVLTLHEPEPACVWPSIYIGVVLMLPTVIHYINEILKENNNGKDYL
jgi:tetrahydromethanopterin S-methyltransferase subunit D